MKITTQFLLVWLIATIVVVSTVQYFDWEAIFTFLARTEGTGKTSFSEVVRNVGLLAVAVVGLFFGIWRAITAHYQTVAAQKQATSAQKQAEIAEQGHITDRYSKAVDMLGNEKSVSVRIGAIYALGRIAHDSPERDHIAVMNVLTNFVRYPPYIEERKITAAAINVWENEEKPKEFENQKPFPDLIECPDVIAAIEILQSRTDEQRTIEEKYKYELSLERANLSYLRLIKINLSGLNLNFSTFAHADLSAAQLNGTKLFRAELNHASLFLAVIEFANLNSAELNHADLNGAKLNHASLNGAQLIGAFLYGAELKHTNLSWAKLNHAYLNSAKLNHADLTGAKFTSAELSNANFYRATKTPNLSKAFTLPGQPIRNPPDGVVEPPERKPD